jgi:nicotinate-nucleotide adenylyltransferase
MRIGLIGGTFDPVHYGHLVIAEEARHCFRLDRVIWIPAGDPPHKDEKVTPEEHRYSMVLLATASHPSFEVNRLELEREGPSYTLHTLLHFRSLYPESELYFIIGADAVLELLTWYRHDEVIRTTRFIAVTRPGYDLALLSGTLPSEYMRRIDTVAAPGVDISSTELRTRVREGEPIRYLVPETVEDYIRKNGLYKPGVAPES